MIKILKKRKNAISFILYLLTILMFSSVLISHIKAGGLSRGSVLYKSSGLKKEDQEKQKSQTQHLSIDQGTGLIDAKEEHVMYMVEFWTADGKRMVGKFYPVSQKDVRKDVKFGPHNKNTGDLVLPDETSVLSGVGYGSEGTEFIGTYVPASNDSGTGIMDAVSVDVLTNREFWRYDGTRITGQYYPVLPRDVKKGIVYGPNKVLTGTFTGIPIRTGQTVSYRSGDDGTYRKGYTGGYTNSDGTWKGSTRFTDHGNGTVTDNLTGLMWTKDADQGPGQKNWDQAIDIALACNVGGYTDWRLPNITEFLTLIDFNNSPVLPINHPFINHLRNYWSSTERKARTNHFNLIKLRNGDIDPLPRSHNASLWFCRSNTL